MLKQGMVHLIMKKKKEDNIHHQWGKPKELLDKRRMDFAADRPRTYAAKIHNDEYEVKDSLVKKTNGVKKSISKELSFCDFEK